MVEDVETDGTRIAEILSSEVTGHGNPPFDRFAVTNADPDVEPTTDGAHAFDVTLDGERVAAVYVQPDRARVELTASSPPVVDSRLDAAREAAEEYGLRARPVGGDPPRLVVFLERGVASKRALDVLGVVADAT